MQRYTEFSPHRAACLLVAAIAAMPAACPVAMARQLTVGEGGAYPRLSDAARVAQPGDQVQLFPGTFYDCAVWSVDGVVISGSGPDTVLTDRTCQDKAILVITGRGVTVQDLVLTRARVADNNGAGLRAEGADLLVRRVRFVNNQIGLLAGDEPSGTLRVEGCSFVSNGVAGGERPTAALAVGHWARLAVRDTLFQQGRGGTEILSRAALTELADSRIEAPEVAGDAAVQAAGGLLAERNLLWAGPASWPTAILALPGDARAPLILRGNVLRGRGTLLLNWSGRPPLLEANQVQADAAELSETGAWSHRLRGAARTAYDAMRGMARALRGRVLRWARVLGNPEPDRGSSLRQAARMKNVGGMQQTPAVTRNDGVPPLEHRSPMPAGAVGATGWPS